MIHNIITIRKNKGLNKIPILKVRGRLIAKSYR